MLVKIAREQQFFTLLSTMLHNARVSYNMQSAIGGLLKKKQNLDHVKLSWQFTVASRRVL